MVAVPRDGYHPPPRQDLASSDCQNQLLRKAPKTSYSTAETMHPDSVTPFDQTEALPGGGGMCVQHFVTEHFLVHVRAGQHRMR